MLIKIDHICYSCQKGTEDVAKSKFCGYHEVFYQREVPNLSIKQKRCIRENVSHDMIYLEKAGSFPIEITSYENIALEEGGFTFDYHNSVMETYSDHIQTSIAFLELCGAKREADHTGRTVMSMRGLLDKQALTIIIKQAKKPKPWILDRGGNACLGLIVRNLESTKQKIRKAFEVTETKELPINGRILKLFFAFGLCGETIEFISV